MSSMSGKRSRPDDMDEKHKKPRYAYKQDSKHFKKNSKSNSGASSSLSVNDLKNKIRATKRLLDHSKKLPADVRIEKERALKGYQRDLEKTEEKKARNALIAKYHFVRFLERKTAAQNLKKLQRMKSKLEKEDEMSTSTSKSKKDRLAELESKLYTTQVDLNYAIYSPLTEKYISIFPSQGKEREGKRKDKKGEDDEKQEKDNGDEPSEEEEQSALGQRLAPIKQATTEKPPLWFTVEQSMKDGTLDALREGRLGISVTGEKKSLAQEQEEKRGAVTSAGQSDVTRRHTITRMKKAQGGVALDSEKQRNGEVDEDEESDGGFFEK